VKLIRKIAGGVVLAVTALALAGVASAATAAAAPGLHVGGKCIATRSAAYRAHGFACINGRLHRVRTVKISVGDASVAEGSSGATTLSVPVRLSAASRSVVVVDYSTMDLTAVSGSDYVAPRGTLTFRPGEKAKVIPISVLGDTRIEADETFFVTLFNPTNATLAKSEATATIANDDTAARVGPGSYQGATQNGNYVFFALGADRTITGFKVNDLPLLCDDGGRTVGGIDFGSDIFPVDSGGRISAESTWSSSVDDWHWTNVYAKVTGFFDNPTTVSGTIVWKGDLEYKGAHFRCSSGDIRWSATRQS
jgi:hypothetical protein